MDRWKRIKEVGDIYMKHYNYCRIHLENCKKCNSEKDKYCSVIKEFVDDYDKELEQLYNT